MKNKHEWIPFLAGGLTGFVFCTSLLNWEILYVLLCSGIWGLVFMGYNFAIAKTYYRLVYNKQPLSFKQAHNLSYLSKVGVTLLFVIESSFYSSQVVLFLLLLDFVLGIVIFHITFSKVKKVHQPKTVLLIAFANGMLLMSSPMLMRVLYSF